jgi:hypothetical protein
MLSFPKMKLPSGVTQITLFNAEGRILSELLTFINHHSQLKMDVVQNKGSYNAYEKVNFDFQLSDMKNQPVETTFSLAVRDAGSSSFNPYSDNVLTNLLLSSELKGYIENPGYYFEKDTPARKGALDLLLLTQGWTRYVWQQMAGVLPFEVKHPIEESLVIEGKVLSWMKKKPKSNVDVIMTLISDTTSQRGACITDQDGKFNLALQDFYGKSNLMLQTKEKGKLSENFIMLERAFSPKMKILDHLERKNPDNYLLTKKVAISVEADTIRSIEPTDKNINSNINTNKKSHLLGEVTVKERKIHKREGEALRDASIVVDVEKSVDQLIDKGEDERTNLLDFMMQINPYFSYIIGSGGRYKTNDVVFVYNNDVVDTFEEKCILESTTTAEIETVTVNEKTGTSIIYNNKNTGFEVVIFIYTYKNFRRRTEPVGMRKTKLQGYSAVKEFFNPRYDYTPLPNEKDYRRTLYWNPDVKTDANGKATVTFYNNSSCNNFNISAETVTENGVIGVINKY